MESLNDYLSTPAFQKLYNDRLKVNLEEIDIIINKKLKITQPSFFISAGVIAITLILLKISLPNDNRYTTAIVLVGIIAYITLISYTILILSTKRERIDKVRSIYKNKVLVPVLHAYYSDVNYHPKRRLSYKTRLQSLLYTGPDDQRPGEDYFAFEINKTFIHFSEIDISSTFDKKVINNIFLCADFPKKFRCNCVIKNESISTDIFNNVYKAFIGENKDREKLHIIKLEHSNFERKFKVYSNDPVESRYILTPSFMKRLYEFHLKIGYDIEFSFVSNRMYMIIHSKNDLFEPNFSTQNENIENLKAKLNFIGNLTDIVLHLNLDSQIWKA